MKTPAKKLRKRALVLLLGATVVLSLGSSECRRGDLGGDLWEAMNSNELAGVGVVGTAQTPSPTPTLPPQERRVVVTATPTPTSRVVTTTPAPNGDSNCTYTQNGSGSYGVVCGDVRTSTPEPDEAPKATPTDHPEETFEP